MAVAAVFAVGVGVAVFELWPGPPPKPPIQPICVAATSSGTYSLDIDQAENATTIAVTAKRLGLPDHAVTIGLAAALQESGLHNLDHGDRDSLGLFQQRPSQGWGAPSQIMSPPYAAGQFFRHLARIPNWQTLPIDVAAQEVQRSAAPDAYGDWEDQARVIAEVLTGEEPAGFTCRYPAVELTAARRASSAAALRAQLANELGRDPTGAAATEKDGWVVAAWVVGHAQRYGLRSVSFAGQRWTSSRLAWKRDPPANLAIRTDPPM